MTTLPRRTLLSAAALLALGAHLPARAARVGQPAPDFALPDTAGKTVRLADFRARYVVLEWTNPGCPLEPVSSLFGVAQAPCRDGVQGAVRGQ